MKRTLPALAAILALGALACGEGTAPPETAVLEAVVRDDPVTLIAAGARGLSFAHHKQFGAAYYHGTLGARVQVLLSVDGVSFVPLGSPGPTSLALQDGGAEATLHEAGEVPVGTYRHVRLVISDAAAELTAGSTFGSTELAEGASLQLAGPAGFVVDLELPAPLQLGPGQAVTLVFDLNSEMWVSGEEVARGSVDPGKVAGAVSVGLRLPEVALSLAL